MSSQVGFGIALLALGCVSLVVGAWGGADGFSFGTWFGFCVGAGSALVLWRDE